MLLVLVRIGTSSCATLLLLIHFFLTVPTHAHCQRYYLTWRLGLFTQNTVLAERVLFALQVTMTQTPQDRGTNVADILANSSNPSDPAEPAAAAPAAAARSTATSAQIASKVNSQGLGTAGLSAPSVSPSKATNHVSIPSHTTCTLFSSLIYAYTRRNSFFFFFLASFSPRQVCGPHPRPYFVFPTRDTLCVLFSSFLVFLSVVLGFPGCLSCICYPGLSPSYPVALFDVACSYALIYVVIALCYLYKSALLYGNPSRC